MLTEEAIKILSAPVPRSEVKTKTIQGNTIRFTDVQFVESRLAAADPSYGKLVELGPKGIIVTLTVLGVSRAGSADVVDVKGYGSPVKNAEAQALKRAAKSFGVAAELWDKDEEAHEDAEEETPRAKSSYSGNTNNRNSTAPSNNGAKTPSDAQLKFLTGNAFLVPASVARELTGGRDGTASAMIEALKAEKAKLDDEDAYDDDPNKYIAKALKKIAPNLIPLLNEDTESDDEDVD